MTDMSAICAAVACLFAIVASARSLSDPGRGATPEPPGPRIDGPDASGGAPRDFCQRGGHNIYHDPLYRHRSDGGEVSRAAGYRDRDIAGQYALERLAVRTILRARVQGARGNRPLLIVLLGDSTMFGQALFLWNGVLDDACSLDSRVCHGHDTIEWRTCASAALNVTVVHRFVRDCAGRAHLEEVWARFLASYPDAATLEHVVYITCGLHLLHFGTARAFEDPTATALFDRHLAETAATAQRLMVNPLLVWMTPHFVCSELYGNVYGAQHARYRARPSDIADECVSRHPDWAPPADLPAAAWGIAWPPVESLALMCASAVLLDEGSRYVARRAHRVIEHFNMAVVDGHGITDRQCWASGDRDGRHYVPLVPQEVHALARIMVRRFERAADD